MAEGTLANETTLKVLLVGDAEVGKSSLIKHISGEEFQVSYTNTIGEKSTFCIYFLQPS